MIFGILCRFGDTSSNFAVMNFLNNYSEITNSIPLPLKTACSSVIYFSWRLFLMPLDTLTAILNVEGKKGYGILYNKIKTKGLIFFYFKNYNIKLFALLYQILFIV